MKITRARALAACVALFLAAGGAWAHGGATGIVKERMDLMERIGDAMKALTAMMRDKTPYDSEEVRRLARSISDHGGDSMTSLFPEDSIEGPSEALPSIWQDWARFATLAGRLADYAGALAQAAGNERAPMAPGGGMMAGQGMMAGSEPAGPPPERLAEMAPDAAFWHLAQTCASCHESFRKEK